jgi:hypothetical protein
MLHNNNRIGTHPATHEQKENIDPQRQKVKWAAFASIGKEAKRIIKVLKKRQ